MTEEFCEQCGQALVPNARFCAVCGWETGSQATLPLPQGLTGNYGGSGYPQQGAPTPLEEFEQEFERQSTYEPAYDPYDQYGNDSYANDSGDHGSRKGSGKRGKKKRNSAKDKAGGKGSKPAAAKRSTGKSTKKATAPNGAHDPGKSRRHPVTAIAITILACIVVVFSGVGIVRMMASANGTVSGLDASSSSSSSAGAKDETPANNSQNSTPVTGKTSKKAAQQQDTQPPADGRYLNARFGYAVTIPSGFTWQAESADGDGRTFTDGQTGMTIAAWGSNNALHETVISAFKQATAGHSVSYQQILDSEFTATWEENGTITYIREMVSAGTIRAVRFTYPSTHRNECDRFVEQVVPTLTATDATTAGSGQ